MRTICFSLVLLCCSVTRGVDTGGYLPNVYVTYPTESCDCQSDDSPPVRWIQKAQWGASHAVLVPEHQRSQVGIGSSIIVPNNQLHRYHLTTRQRSYTIAVPLLAR